MNIKCRKKFFILIDYIIEYITKLTSIKRELLKKDHIS